MEKNDAIMDRFVARLWQHVRLRALHADDQALEMSCKQVHESLRGFDPLEQWEEVGEALAAHILQYTVEHYSRPQCIACRNFVGCPTTESGPCEKFARDEQAYASGRAMLADAIYMLDGVYGIDAQELLSILCRFLDEMAGSSEQMGIEN